MKFECNYLCDFHIPTKEEGRRPLTFIFCVFQCPQCNRKCSMKDVRKLYASRIVAVDEESQKVVSVLRTKESVNFQEYCLSDSFFSVCREFGHLRSNVLLLKVR